mmetsp:Transcript_97495/g.276292  ORF Transcript_97495/g.276292 Transcript_97495/m.276292 type:complete len:258 (-) Transcript_97495:164-937(-)
MADSGSSSSASSTEDVKSKKKLEKKRSKHLDKKGKKKEAHRDRKKGKVKKHKRKASPSSSSPSASPVRKGSKKEAKRKWGNDAVQKAWVHARQKAIRKAEPEVSKDEALRKAIGEYLMIFAEKVVPVELPDAKLGRKDTAVPEGPLVVDGPVADAIAEAEQEAEQTGRAAGKSEQDIKAGVQDARNAVLYVAQQAGMWKPPTPETMFAKHVEWEQSEAKRLSTFVPSTADDAAVQLARNEADRLAARDADKTARCRS